MSYFLRKLAPFRIPLADIVSATNDFAVENLIKEGRLADIYKGRLLLQSGEWINVVVRRFRPMYDISEDELMFDIISVSEIKHSNAVSLVGFCEDNGQKIMVLEYVVNGSLDKYITDPTLTWPQRLKICLGAAVALSHINSFIAHPRGGFHHDIKSSKILLDKNWEAKVFCFGFHLKNSVVFYYTSCYTDPDPVFKTNGYGSKTSDVYSLGVILFEVLCGRNAMINRVDQDLVSLAKQHYEKGTLDEIIDPDLRRQMHPQSLFVFSETAYKCLNGRQWQRPSMDDTEGRLREALDLQLKLENLEKNFARLTYPLNDIKLATDNFAEKYRIESQEDGMVYKSKLGFIDSKGLNTIEGKNIDELSKRHNAIAIKRIFSRKDGKRKHGFFEEIEMLTSCKHPNIVCLLGFCIEGFEMIIVYENSFKGSLDDYLGNTSKTTNLTWEQRIRICLDIARGLEFLHNSMRNNPSMMHQGIKSANVLLDEKWNAKIANFTPPKFDSQSSSAIHTNDIARRSVYVDSEYSMTHMLTKESSTYSFGVILFEILSGRLAYDSIYIEKNVKGLAPIAQQHFNERTLKEIIDPKIMEEAQGHIFTSKKGPNQDSLDTFSKIAHQCLAETKADRLPANRPRMGKIGANRPRKEETVVGRPSMEVVIKSLEKALHFQVSLRFKVIRVHFY